MTTKEDIKREGGKCEKVSTDFWLCTDKDGTVWWCNSNTCVKAPTKQIKPIDELEKEGAKCRQVSEDLVVCLDVHGDVWLCKYGTCTGIITRNEYEQECERKHKCMNVNVSVNVD